MPCFLSHPPSTPTYHLLLITYHLLLSTYYLLLTTYYLLLTTYYSLAVGWGGGVRVVVGWVGVVV